MMNEQTTGKFFLPMIFFVFNDDIDGFRSILGANTKILERDLEHDYFSSSVNSIFSSISFNRSTQADRKVFSFDRRYFLCVVDVFISLTVRQLIVNIFRSNKTKKKGTEKLVVKSMISSGDEFQ